MLLALYELPMENNGGINVTLSFQTCLNLRFGSNAKTGLAKGKVWLSEGRVQESSNQL